MKIKYLDKFHKKLKKDGKLENKIVLGTGVGIISAALFAFSVYGGTKIYNNDVHNKIMETYYKIGEDKVQLKDIYLLYKGKEIRKCRREKENKTNIYKFYDIKTNEFLAMTDSSLNSSHEIKDEEKEEVLKYMNGYKYINLGQVLFEDSFKEYFRINQFYIDEYIENKRFLGK